MIGFISTLVTISLNYNQYSAIVDLHMCTFHFTVAHALGFSVSSSRPLATDLNTETSTSNHCEVFLPFLVQSPWNLGTQLKTLLDSPHSLISSWHGPHRKHLSPVRLRVRWSVICAGRGADDTENSLLYFCVT
jgi:hypothetical protein